MTVNTAETDHDVTRGVYPLDPAGDLGTIARLVADASADEINDRGRATP
ncbi:hypothetical protein ACFLT5_00035 [Chloroflexota bacterium]